MIDMINPDEELDKHFVYIFRDKAGNPVYVGRGREGERPLAHFSERAHNAELSEIIKKEAVTVEAAGPLGSQATAAAVESALISAFRLTPLINERLKNIDPGSPTGRFRPLGVPSEFVARGIEPPLTIADLLAAANDLPVIAVLITSRELSDGREGFEMARPPDDQAIIDRMVKWWPIGRKEMQRWESEQNRRPGLLIAMSGTVSHRVVVGALEIDRRVAACWEPSEKKAGRFKIPTKPSAKLDFAGLRGRLIEKEAGWSHQTGIRFLWSVTG